MGRSSSKPASGWKTLGLWVTLAFLALIAAWVALIKVANRYAPEPVPLERSEEGERGEDPAP